MRPLLIASCLLAVLAGGLAALGLAARGEPAGSGQSAGWQDVGRSPDGKPSQEEAAPGAEDDAASLPLPPPGLTYEPAEVARWRERATHGPYREAGDVSPGSPGDWRRITGNAERFLDDPDEGRWEGPDGEGCVEAGDDGPPTDGIQELRDAAFVALVTDDEELREAVGEALLEQAGEDDLDFADEDRWCGGEVLDNRPGFEVAAWMAKHLLAYDYLGEDAFSDDEHERLRRWFRHAARWLEADVARSLDENFVDREAGDYRLSEERVEDPGWGEVGFVGSQPTGAIARYYNNRRATAMFFVALVGVQQADEELIDSSRRFFEEWLAFGVYPDGWTGEFERWREDLPDLGWAYSTYNAALASMTADLLARHGDDALLRFSTDDGAHGTSGGPKDLRSVLLEHTRYLDGTYERYATDRPSLAGQPEHRIDGVHEAADWHSVHDLAWLVVNRHYRDPQLRAVALRTAPGTDDYPEEPASQGAFSAWSGVWGIYPGVLFMHGG